MCDALREEKNKRDREITNMLLMFSLTCLTFFGHKRMGFSAERTAVWFLSHKVKPHFISCIPDAIFPDF
jgi:hypothetical protein